MEITRLADLKPRSVWEITDDAFDLYRERFVLLVSISAVTFAPALLIYHAFLSKAAENFTHLDEGPGFLLGFYRNLGLSLPLLIVYAFQAGATAFAVRDALNGQESTLGSAYKQTFKKFLPLFFTSLLVGLGILLSSITLIVPLFISIWYIFAPYGILLEDRKIFDAAKRSRDIAVQYFGTIFGLLLLLTAITSLLSLGFQGIIELVFNLLPKDPSSSTPYSMEATQKIVTMVISSLITVLFAPITAIAMTLLYYDLRVRREGLDMESEATEWGVTLAPDPFGGVLNPKLPKANKAGGKK